MIVEYFAFALIGKVLLYLLQKFPLTVYLASKWKTAGQLVDCDLCLGFWVYLALGIFFPVYILTPYQAVFSEIITASVTTFVVHLVSVGWSERFGMVVIN